MAGQPSFDSETGGEIFPETQSSDGSHAPLTEFDSDPDIDMEEGTPGRASSTFLFTLSVVCVVAGVTLMSASRISPEFASIATQLDVVGLQGGAVLLVGVVCFGLACVACSITGLARPHEVAQPDSADSDFMIVADQLALDLSKVLAANARMSDEIAAIADGQRVLVAAQNKAPNSAAADEVNAIFRLAASVDQSSANVNERLHEFDLQLRSGFEKVAKSIAAVQVAAKSRTVPAAELLAPPVSVEREAPVAHQEAAPTVDETAEANPFIEEEPTLPQASIDEPMEFLDAMERLDEPAEVEVPVDEPPAPFTSKDSIDRLDALLPDESLRRALEGE